MLATFTALLTLAVAVVIGWTFWRIGKAAAALEEACKVWLAQQTITTIRPPDPGPASPDAAATQIIGGLRKAPRRTF